MKDIRFGVNIHGVGVVCGGDGGGGGGFGVVAAAGSGTPRCPTTE